jgi:hypothetical protein
VEHDPGRVVSPVAPDGDRFISRRSDGSLWVATLSPRAATRLSFSLQANQSIKEWSDDGQHLFMLTLHDERAELTRVDVKTGQMRLHADVTRDRMALRSGYSVFISRDGRTIVYSDTRVRSDLFLIEGAR